MCVHVWTRDLVKLIQWVTDMSLRKINGFAAKGPARRRSAVR